MALISNTIDIRGNNAPTFWKITGYTHDVCTKGKIVDITVSGYTSPMKCAADPERYSFREDAKTYTFQSTNKTGITEDEAYYMVKLQTEFSNAIDCLDWQQWDEARWRAYCDAVSAGTDTTYIIDKTQWDAYISSLTNETTNIE